MTNEQFQKLCDSVLIPRIENLLRGHLKETNETLETVANEMLRTSRGVDLILAYLGEREEDEDRE